VTTPPKTQTGLLFDRLFFKKEMKPLQGIGMTTKRLLLIHKNPTTIGEVIQACLTDLVGWKVEVASSTEEGLRQASLYQPDAIILEVSLGEIDGLLFLKQLKTQPETQGIPVMLLTLKAQWSDYHRVGYTNLNLQQRSSIVSNQLCLPLRLRRCWVGI
jgi:CheY-like chemotaxis protein